MPANLLKFAGLKEQAIVNLKLPTELQTQADCDYGSDATQKQALGQQTARFTWAPRGEIKHTARTEDALSWLHSPHCWQVGKGLILVKTGAASP